MNPTLVCPACHGVLHEINGVALNCSACAKSYPISKGVPVLINEANSVFTINGCVPARVQSKSNSGGIKAKVLGVLSYLQKLAPGISLNLKAAQNYKRFAAIMLGKNENPTVLVIGGRTLGAGMEQITELPIKFIGADVSMGPQTNVICDAHDLPFADGSFDGVIIQAVMEYVVDPYRVAAEIHRVLKDGAPVYAESPFIQQVHGRQFDFMRFTHLGHRRLFRQFAEVDSGACVGTGSALAWSWKYFVLSFSDRGIVRELLLLLANWTAFPLKYFDYLTIHKRATLDAASGYYFLGTKSNVVLTDKELIEQYRGML